MPRETVVTKRNLIYEQIRKELADLGYDPIRPVLIDRWMRYRIFVIAVNQLASILQREPVRVYQALLDRARKTTRGTPNTPSRQAKATAEGLREWEETTGGLHLVCPYCHKDLLGAGRETKQEVLAEIKFRTNATQSPTKA